MLIPTTEAEIRSAMHNGTLVESAGFDAKQELPARGRNKDLAKDICAMTIDGGVLLYGIGGADPTRPDRLVPFDRTGASERIDQVTQNGIREPPTIEIHDIDSVEQPGLGLLVRRGPRLASCTAHGHDRFGQPVLGPGRHRQSDPV